ncbi:MAG: radical SAM peptide maturase, CXXX-repeat target family [Erysipelotrichia bacterium]|nr:radical SAM peptide maturase, CXXX-repeat target family [Erysipelotrichia bacterium]
MSDKTLKKTEPGFTDMYRESFKSNGTGTSKVITFVVTEGCTMRCSYCYETKKNEEHKMSFETAHKIVDFMYESDLNDSLILNKEKAEAVILEFIGGEPLMAIDVINEAVEYFGYKGMLLDHRWQNRYMISITTNGTLYFNPKVQTFFEKYRERISLGITIDGNKNLHDACRFMVDGSGSFDIVQKAFKDALQKGYVKSTKLTISPDNLPFLAVAIKELLMYEGMETIFANVIYEHKWTKEEAKLFYFQLKEIADWLIETENYATKATSLFEEHIGHKVPEEDNMNYCGGTGAMLAFGYEGTMYPCLRYAPLSLSFQKSLTFGNVYKGFLPTEEEKETWDMLNAITRRSQSTDECFNCPIGSGCGWCSAWNYDIFGTPNKRSTAICEAHKARVLASSYFFNKINKVLNSPERLKLNVPEEWAIAIIGKEEYEMIKKLSITEE